MPSWITHHLCQAHLHLGGPLCPLGATMNAQNTDYYNQCSNRKTSIKAMGTISLVTRYILPRALSLTFLLEEKTMTQR